MTEISTAGIIILPYIKGEQKKTLKALESLRPALPFNWAADAIGLVSSQTLDHGKSLIQWVQQIRLVVIGIDESKDYLKISSACRSVLFKVLNGDENAQSVCIIPSFFKAHTISAISNGLSMADMKLGYYKTEQKASARSINFYPLSDKTQIQQAIDEGLSLANVQKEICKLVNLPPNEKTPHFIVEWAKKRFTAKNYTITVLDHEQLRAEGLEALHQVGKGSSTPPYLLIIKYNNVKSKSKSKHLGLVGKGITFDTGGISLKNSLNMYLMKSDMGGAGAVLGAMDIIGRLNMHVRTTAVIPLAENAIGSEAYRPGDVISSYSGKSIEVIDTDAEGRLILADGISYILKNHKPDILLDFATLTGSIITTLGYKAAGLFTNDDHLAKTIIQSGDSCGERVWRLPLWDEYEEEMYSDIADIKNLATKPLAGAITAAKFLQAFTENHPSWAHFDIAGVAMTDNEYGKQRNATAYGVLLLKEWIHHIIK